VIKLFKKKKFTPGVLVHIKMNETHGRENDLIGEILQLILDERLFNIGGGSSCGNGAYVAFHTQQDAKRIRHFVEKWRKKKLAEIKSKRRF